MEKDKRWQTMPSNNGAGAVTFCLRLSYISQSSIFLWSQPQRAATYNRQSKCPGLCQDPLSPMCDPVVPLFFQVPLPQQAYRGSADLTYYSIIMLYYGSTDYGSARYVRSTGTRNTNDVILACTSTASNKQTNTAGACGKGEGRAYLPRAPDKIVSAGRSIATALLPLCNDVSALERVGSKQGCGYAPKYEEQWSNPTQRGDPVDFSEGKGVVCPFLPGFLVLARFMFQPKIGTSFFASSLFRQQGDSALYGVNTLENERTLGASQGETEKGET